MIPHANGKPESSRPQAEELAKLLEIELAQRKIEWAAATERYRKIRTASFVFLALMIMGALFAFFFLFTRLPTAPMNRPTATPASTASP
jgi:hypothetical protein